MSILLVVFTLPIAFVPLVNAQEGQVTLNPTDDTYTDSDNTDSNYGGQDSLIVQKFKDSFENVWEKIAWLKFDLSDVPDGAVVNVATLELYSSIVMETYNVYAHSCSDNSWTESTLTYSNMPSFNATSMDSTLVSSSYEWYSWNVIDTVRKAVDGIHGGPDEVTIVLLETAFRGLISSVYFNSKEDMLYHPKLTVHWSEIIPEFPTLMSMVLILIVITVAVAIFKRRPDKTPLH